MSNERIMAKLKKLLAMAQGKANENEALVAAKQLHAMLAKHNISMAELNKSEEDIGVERDLYVDRPWKRIVALHIARLYFCEMFTSTTGTKKSFYCFAGTEANRTFAKAIFEMVVKTVERESRAASRATYGKEVSSFVNSFWTGAKDRIVERCQELMVAAKAGTLEDEDGTTLPVLASMYDQQKAMVNSFLEDAYNLKSRTARTRANDAAGYKKGQITGSKVQLSRALKQAGPKLIGN